MFPLQFSSTTILKTPVSFDWDFGDGTTSTDKNPIHTYSTVGTYTVNLTVSNENGKDSKTATIKVSEKAVSILPVANFTTNVSEGYAPLTVQFNDNSENAVSFNWDFGDGATSTEKDPIHTYSTAGIYTVNLTVSNENGTDSKTAKINVLENAVLFSQWQISLPMSVKVMLHLRFSLTTIQKMQSLSTGTLETEQLQQTKPDSYLLNSRNLYS